MTAKILVLASNPQGTGQLRLDREIRTIEDTLDRAENRDKFAIRSKVAVRVEDLQRSLLQEKAKIVHFCGHGMGSQGLVLETELGQQQLLDTQAIADLFKLFENQVECVVLNACSSQVQAAEINQHINYVIGTKKEIRDDAAIAFSEGFYGALGDGESIERAYEFGCNRIQLEVYKSSNRERKLVPVYSVTESKWIELPQHEVLVLLKKEPLNSIVESSNSLTVDNATIKERPFVANSPYRGLKRFNAKDKDLFFGRDRLITQIIEAVNQSKSNLVVVLGASGSGKSSVIRAGVLPQLALLQDSQFQTCLFTPDRDPFESFYRSLLNEEKDYDFSKEETKIALEGKSDTLPTTIHRLKSKDSQWLIFIDQFEELFTICSNLEKRTNFIQGIIRIAKDRDRSVKIILAMRSDFLPELSVYPKFARIAEKQINLVADMQPEELRQAIAKPAAKHGVVFEEGLVAEIVQDVQGQAGSLPLLQYTLDLLWQDDDLSDRTLNIETYRRLGGVTGALGKHVNEIFQKLPVEQQLATKQILLRLVDVVRLEKVDSLKTAVSRRAYKSEFIGELEPTINLLIDRSLLVSDNINQEGESTVEIAHEALLTSWTALTQWIKDAREVISINNRLAEDTKNWQDLRTTNSKLANEELWSGSKLEKVVELRKDRIFELVLGGLSPEANLFIDESLGKRDRQIQEKLAAAQELAEEAEARRKAEETARIEAERRGKEQREANHKLSKSKSRIVKLWLITAFFFIFAVHGGIKSRQEATRAELRQKATTIKSELDANNKLENLMKAIQLVGENQKFNGNFLYWLIDGFKSPSNLVDEVQSSLYKAVEASREKAVLFAHQSEELNSQKNPLFKLIATSENGKYIITVNADGLVELWEWRKENNKQPFRKFQIKKSDSNFASIAISNDGKYVLSGGADGTIKLWAAEANKEQLKLKKTFGGSQGHQNIVLAVAISQDGKHIVSAGADNTAKLWDIDDVNKPPKTFGGSQGHQGAVLAVAISQDGKHIVSGGADKMAKLWDIDDVNKPPKTFGGSQGHEKSILSVAISKDAKYIVTASADNIIKSWNINNQRLVADFQGYQGYKKYARSVAIDNDKQEIISVNEDKTIRLWEMNNKVLIKTFPNLKNPITSLVLKEIDNDKTNNELPDIINVNFVDNKIQLWKLLTKNLENTHTFIDKESSISKAAISQNGKYIVSVSEDQSVKIWDVDVKDKYLQKFTLPDNKETANSIAISSMAISNDAKYIITGVTEGDSNNKVNKVLLWDVERKRNKLIGIFEGHEEEVLSVAISEDNKYIVSGSADNTIKLWKVKNLFRDQLNKPIFVGSHERRVSSVAISSDGHYIVSGSVDNTVKLWEVKSNTLLHTFDHHKNGVGSVAISSDAQYIVSGNNNKDIQVDLWQGTNWKEMLEIGCERLRLNPIFASTKIDSASEAADTCKNYGNWNNGEKANFLVAQGKALASEKVDLDGANTKFKEAHQFDSAYDPDQLKIEAKQLAANTLVQQGKNEIQQNNITKALSLYGEAQKLNTDLAFKASSWSSLCWNGSIYGYAKKVLDACEQAVELAPDKASKALYLDSRGLARAITGNTQGAIDDFRAYVDSPYIDIKDSDEIHRQKWIKALNQGVNPFTEEFLKDFKN